MKKYVCVVVAFISVLIFTKNVYAAEDNEVLPSGLKYSEIEQTIDAYVSENQKTTASVSIAVYSGDNVLFEKAYGYTDVEKQIPNTSEAVCEWGSCTKLLVWTSAMQLAEKGVLDLEADIRYYLPKSFLRKLRYDKPITMLNLMNHNAGWQETVTDLFLDSKSDIKELDDALRIIEPEQINEPGEITAYSNWGTALAGYIIERVSGQSFDDYVQEHIFARLGMEHTAISADLSDNAYVLEHRLQQKCYTTDNKPLGTSMYYLSLYPAGMATGTISDFVKFAQAFAVNDTEASPLFDNPNTLKKMLSPSSYYADGKTARNCHGFWTDQFSVPVLWHNGGTLGSTSWFAFDPVSDIGVVILTNQSNESTYTCGILPKVFGNYPYEVYTDNTTDISGIYVNARSCFHGYAKPYSLISQMPIQADKESGYFTPGTDNHFDAIGDSTFLMSMGVLKPFIIYERTDDRGRRILQLPGSDYIEVNGFGVIGEYLLLLLFALAAIYSMVTILLKIVRLFRRSKKKHIFESYRLAVNLSVIISLAVFIYITLNLFSNTPMYAELRWSIILNAVCSIVPITYLLYLIVKWKTIDGSKKVKACLILNSIAGLIMTINVLFWEAYKFW